MTREYTGFPIANFRVGFDEALEPWMLPRDAFQVLKNAHLYRGVVEKIPGYLLFATMGYKVVTVPTVGAINGVNKTYTGTIISFPVTTNITVQSTINAGATLVENFIYDGPGVAPGSINLTSNLGGVGVILSGVQYNSVLFASDRAPGTLRPIMGIKPFLNSNGSQDVLIFDTKRAGKIVVLDEPVATNVLAANGISEIPHETQSLAITTGFNNTVGPFTGTVNTFLLPGSVQFDM